MVQLRAVNDLLNLSMEGKKHDLVSRIHDWVHAISIEKDRKRIEEEAWVAEQFEGKKKRTK